MLDREHVREADLLGHLHLLQRLPEAVGDGRLRPGTWDFDLVEQTEPHRLRALRRPQYLAVRPLVQLTITFKCAVEWGRWQGIKDDDEYR